MYCYRCNGTLDLKKDTCSKCGTDVRMFKKIVYASNRKYNAGLQKAEARNLSGAVEDLKVSLHLYKKNIQARNLLGLVYYAMGESAEALKEWSISKSLTASPGLQDRFINSMQKNMRELNSEANCLKRFNQALGYAKNNAKDLAVIQLKKVISTQPNMTKAYNLLALIYMEDGKYDQAEKVLVKCLETDRGNDTAIRYLKSIRELDESDNAKSLGTVGAEDREQLIIPVRFRDYGTYLSNALYILLGLVLGILIAWFVIVPGRVEREMSGVDAAYRSYEERISELQSRAAEYSREAETEPAEPVDPASSTEAEPAPSTEPAEEDGETMPVIEKNPDAGGIGWAKNQEDVAKALEAFGATPPDYAELIQSIFRVDASQLSVDNQTHYRNLMINLFADPTYQRMQAMAFNYEATEDYENMAALYEALSVLHPEAMGYRNKAGQAYEKLGDEKKAANLYWQEAILFPDTEQGKDAEFRYSVLTDRLILPPYRGSTPLEEFKKPLSFDEIVSKIGGPTE